VFQPGCHIHKGWVWAFILRKKTGLNHANCRLMKEFVTCTLFLKRLVWVTCTLIQQNIALTTKTKLYGQRFICTILYTDKKENQIFLIYKEIQSGAVAKSYDPAASSYMGKNLRLYSYIRKPFLIYDFSTAPLWISLYIRKIWFSFYQCRVQLF
jgi:hypothetical protein